MCLKYKHSPFLNRTLWSIECSCCVISLSYLYTLQKTQSYAPVSLSHTIRRLTLYNQRHDVVLTLLVVIIVNIFI